MEERIICSHDGKINLIEDCGMLRLPKSSEAVLAREAEIFRFSGYLAVTSPDVEWKNPGITERNLRESWPYMDRRDYTAAVKGFELINWARDERFCPSDGTPLLRASEISKKCNYCGREFFPRLNPAIVVLVKKDDQALLVHARNLRGQVHALVAGFVETGESLEECVAREVKEETSLEISDIKYVGSQAWPYPYQLMMGFTARYKSGTMEFADGELTSGGFFSRDNVPQIPPPPSLTRSIIDRWINGEL